MSKKLKAKKTAKEIKVLNRNGQIKDALESIFSKKIKNIEDSDIKYSIDVRSDKVYIHLSSEYEKIGSFVNFALLKEISNKLNTDLIDLGTESRSRGCDTCDFGAVSTLTITITL